MYPEKAIFDVAGFRIKGRELVEGLVEQAASSTDVPPRAGAKNCPAPATVSSRCAPMQAPSPIACSDRQLVASERQRAAAARWGGLDRTWPHFFVPDSPSHGSGRRDRGGGDSACDWVLSLEPIARSITLSIAGPSFAPTSTTVELVHRSSARSSPMTRSARCSAETPSRPWRSTLTTDPRSHRPAQRVIAATGVRREPRPLQTGESRSSVTGTSPSTRRWQPAHRCLGAGDITDYHGQGTAALGRLRRGRDRRQQRGR